MTSNRKLMIMPGDGIGPEVMKETLRLIDWLAKNKTLNFDTIERDVGGKSYDLHGTPPVSYTHLTLPTILPV